jgi:hypothetical protein
VTKLTDAVRAPVLDLWSAFEALRRLGFSSDHIYFSRCRDATDPAKRFAAAVELRCQGKSFIIIVPSTRHKNGATVTAYMDELQQLMLRKFDTLPQDEMLDHFFGWLASMGGAMSLVNGLVNKGFHIPGKSN